MEGLVNNIFFCLQFFFFFLLLFFFLEMIYFTNIFPLLLSGHLQLLDCKIFVYIFFFFRTAIYKRVIVGTKSLIFPTFYPSIPFLWQEIALLLTFISFLQSLQLVLDYHHLLFTTSQGPKIYRYISEVFLISLAFCSLKSQE